MQTNIKCKTELIIRIGSNISNWDIGVKFGFFLSNLRPPVNIINRPYADTVLWAISPLLRPSNLNLNEHVGWLTRKGMNVWKGRGCFHRHTLGVCDDVHEKVNLESGKRTFFTVKKTGKKNLETTIHPPQYFANQHYYSFKVTYVTHTWLYFSSIFETYILVSLFKNWQCFINRDFTVLMFFSLPFRLQSVSFCPLAFFLPWREKERDFACVFPFH